MEHTDGPGESGQGLLWYCSGSICCVQQCRPTYLMQPLAGVQGYFSWTNAAEGRTDCSRNAPLVVAEFVGRIYLGAGIDAIWVATGACSATSRAAPLTTVHSLFGAVGIRDAMRIAVRMAGRGRGCGPGVCIFSVYFLKGK